MCVSDRESEKSFQYSMELVCHRSTFPQMFTMNVSRINCSSLFALTLEMAGMKPSLQTSLHVCHQKTTTTLFFSENHVWDFHPRKLQALVYCHDHCSHSRGKFKIFVSCGRSWVLARKKWCLCSTKLQTPQTCTPQKTHTKGIFDVDEASRGLKPENSYHGFFGSFRVLPCLLSWCHSSFRLDNLRFDFEIIKLLHLFGFSFSAFLLSRKR